jgi:hypothetical protein
VVVQTNVIQGSLHIQMEKFVIVMTRALVMSVLCSVLFYALMSMRFV